MQTVIHLTRGLELVAKIPDEHKNAHILDTQGWLEYQRGNHEAAIQALERAKEADESPIVHLHLGLAYLKVNNLVQARTALEKALENGGRGLSNQDKEEAKKALEKLNA